MKLVTVTWNDAASSSTLEYDEERDHKPVVMRTTGWLLKRDDSGISLACEQFTEDGKDKHRGWTFIPAGMIVQVEAVRSRKR